MVMSLGIKYFSLNIFLLLLSAQTLKFFFAGPILIFIKGGKDLLYESVPLNVDAFFFKLRDDFEK